MEDYYYENTSKKEIIFKLFLGIVIVACFILLIIFMMNKDNVSIKKNIEMEAGEVLPKDISFYVKSKVQNEKDYTVTVDNYTLGEKITKTGKYNYKVEFKDKVLKGTITVKDTTPPTVELSDLIIGVNEEYNPDDFLAKCEDYSKPCTVVIKDEKNESLNKSAGEYDVELVITDTANNKTTKKAKLIVKENYSKEKVAVKDTTIVKTSSEEDIDISENDAFKMYDHAFSDDPHESSEYEDIYEVLETDLRGYLPEEYKDLNIVKQEMIFMYNKYNYIVGFAIKVQLSNGKTIYLHKN